MPFRPVLASYFLLILSITHATKLVNTAFLTFCRDVIEFLSKTITRQNHIKTACFGELFIYLGDIFSDWLIIDDEWHFFDDSGAWLYQW
jgi:hypothetical protein